MSDAPAGLTPAGEIDAPVTARTIVFIVCVALFTASLISAAVLAMKVQTFELFGLVLLVPAGTLAFCLTYAATDVISEVWGRGHALAVVFAGLAMRVLLFVMIFFALEAEAVFPFVDTAPFWTAEHDAAFEFVLAGARRVNFAGFAAFGAAAIADVLIFHWLRQRQQGRNRLWLRNNISTMVSQVFNSTVFILVAFGGTLGWAALGSLILGQVIAKAATAVLDTPFVYLMRNLATGRRWWDWRG